MARVARLSVSSIALSLLAAHAGPAWAQTPPQAPSADPAPAEPTAPPEDPALARAKRLFFEGNELRQAGDCHGALPFFLDLAPRCRP